LAEISDPSVIVSLIIYRYSVQCSFIPHSVYELLMMTLHYYHSFIDGISFIVLYQSLTDDDAVTVMMLSAVEG